MVVSRLRCRSIPDVCEWRLRMRLSPAWENRSDVRSPLSELFGVGALGVCAVLRAGTEFYLFSGGPICGVADVSCGDGRGGCAAAAGDGVGGFGGGAGRAKRFRGCGAVYFPDVRDYAAGVRDCGRHYSAAHRTGYVGSEAVADAGIDRGDNGG